jgi:hypothetical protein
MYVIITVLVISSYVSLACWMVMVMVLMVCATILT